MIKICLTEDHQLVRTGLRRILDGTAGFRVTTEASSGEELLEKARGSRWDVVVLDLSLPGRGGLEVLRDLKEINPEQRVLILTMHSEDQYAVRAFRAGADGYLTKESAPDNLADGIRHVVSGRKYISERIAELLAADVSPSTSKLPHETLSDREYQVFSRLGAGSTVTGIAQTLSLSAKTVSTYRARILQKLGLKNNSEVIHYAVKHNIAN